MLTPERKSELSELIAELRSIQNTIYYRCLRIGAHEFQTFAAITAAYIDLCGLMLDAGKDFLDNPDVVDRPDKMRYLGEKIGRLFGSYIRRSRASHEMFLVHAGLSYGNGERAAPVWIDELAHLWRMRAITDSANADLWCQCANELLERAK